MRLSLVVCILSCSSLRAQCVQESMPPFAGGQFYMSLSEAPGQALGVLKCEGFTAMAPVPWPPGPAPTTPNFDLDWAFRNMLTPSCSVGPTDPLPDVDAMSIGMDWVLATPDGFVAVQPDSWGALTLTVSSASRGRAGSAIALEAARGGRGGAGADVFSYALRGSVLPPYLVQRTVRAHDAAEMGLRDDGQIDALDQFIAMYRMDALVQSPGAGRLPAQPTLYFSVTAATVGRVPVPWWGGLQGAERNGAVIFQTTWNAAARRWGCALPWRSGRQLGLRTCEDIDALALDLERAQMLFSTVADRGCITRDQIMYANLNHDGDPAPVPYMTHTNQGDTTVSSDADLLGADDVKAICSLDPLTPRRTTNSPTPFNVLRMTIGTPTRHLTFPGIPRTLQGTTFLACLAGVPRLHTYGLGWPDGTPDAGFAAAFLTIPGLASPPVLLATFARTPTAPDCGDPRELRLAIPPHLRLHVQPHRVEISWVALRTATLRFGQAHPVAIDL